MLWSKTLAKVNVLRKQREQGTAAEFRGDSTEALQASAWPSSPPSPASSLNKLCRCRAPTICHSCIVSEPHHVHSRHQCAQSLDRALGLGADWTCQHAMNPVSPCHMSAHRGFDSTVVFPRTTPIEQRIHVRISSFHTIMMCRDVNRDLDCQLPRGYVSQMVSSDFAVTILLAAAEAEEIIHFHLTVKAEDTRRREFQVCDLERQHSHHKLKLQPATGWKRFQHRTTRRASQRAS